MSSLEQTRPEVGLVLDSVKQAARRKGVDPRPTSEIAQALGLSHQATAHALAELVDEGLLRQGTSPQGREGWFLSIASGSATLSPCEGISEKNSGPEPFYESPGQSTFLPGEGGGCVEEKDHKDLRTAVRRCEDASVASSRTIPEDDRRSSDGSLSLEGGVGGTIPARDAKRDAKHCEDCGVELSPERSTKRFCSETCQKRKWRKSRGSSLPVRSLARPEVPEPVEPPAPVEPITGRRIKKKRGPVRPDTPWGLATYFEDSMNEKGFIWGSTNRKALMRWFSSGLKSGITPDQFRHMIRRFAVRPEQIRRNHQPPWIQFLGRREELLAFAKTCHSPAIAAPNRPRGPLTREEMLGKPLSPEEREAELQRQRELSQKMLEEAYGPGATLESVLKKISTKKDPVV